MEQTLSIMFIEDDIVEKMKFYKTLSILNMGHEIIEANNGEHALEILSENDSLPDLILLDLSMPKMNGLEFLEVLKSNEFWKYIPTIILTTSSNHRDILTSYNIGMAGYFTKPLRFEDYVEKIKRVVSYWSFAELIEN
ncbi:response regulator [Maribacter sp. LLG6340-A2]|uniref:response regulator n=1 Tax=Maribacter sp. LLG6340-A2 TaxID=3160834 RepID=UPI003870380E